MKETPVILADRGISFRPASTTFRRNYPTEGLFANLYLSGFLLNWQGLEIHNFLSQIIEGEFDEKVLSPRLSESRQYGQPKHHRCRMLITQRQHADLRARGRANSDYRFRRCTGRDRYNRVSSGYANHQCPRRRPGDDDLPGR